MIFEPSALLQLLKDAHEPLTKADIAKALNVKGNDRIGLKKMLKEAEKNGQIERVGSRYGLPNRLPSVAVVEITEIDIDGDVFATPVPWLDEQGTPPRIEMKPPRTGALAYGLNERVLAKVILVEEGLYTGEAIKRMSAPKNQIMGIMVATKNGFVLSPVDKKARDDYPVIRGEELDAVEGQIVVGEIQPDKNKSLRKAVRIVEIVGHADDPKAISLISIHEYGLRHVFPEAAIKETEGMKVPTLNKREDLRKIPLVTIDGADARDFDDAVFAEKDPHNKGGYHLIVAIADVSYYVRYDSALDREGYARGNSTYFPDRVVPMLPEAISNDLCSLRPKEDRAAMVMHLWIDGEGRLLRYKPTRALIRSAARLTYEQVQAAKDGNPDGTTDPLMDAVINPLYEVYAVLDQARQKRGALDLDLPERKIIIDGNNDMVGVERRIRLDAHKLIEEFMVLTNVAAAKALEDKHAPCVYRIHDKPDADRFESVREFVEGFELDFPKGQVIKPAVLNGLLKQAKEKEGISHLISEVVLRAQSQAVYSQDNVGHFGLALTHYAHFTSPIRRYADLLVHRSMARAYGLGEGGLSKEEEVRLAEMADHISTTERTSMQAERASVDRFTASFLQSQLGAEFEGRISGVTKFAMFVTLTESGADGIIPMRSLKDDYYIHDEKSHALVGKRSGKIFRLGAPIRVRLVDADGMTGSTVLEVVGNQGADIPGYTPKPGAMRFKKDHGYGKKKSDRSGKKGQSWKKGGKKKKKTTPKHKRK